MILNFQNPTFYEILKNHNQTNGIRKCAQLFTPREDGSVWSVPLPTTLGKLGGIKAAYGHPTLLP